MTPQQLVGIAVRLFAVWLAITSISYFASIPAALGDSSFPTDGATAISYFVAASYLGVAVAMWFFPMVVAHKLVPKTQYENKLSYPAHELARVGCALLGIWAFSRALPSLVWFLFKSYLTTGSGSSFSALAPEAKADLLVSVVELLFAVVLVAKAGAFASLVAPGSKTARAESDL